LIGSQERARADKVAVRITEAFEDPRQHVWLVHSFLESCWKDTARDLDARRFGRQRNESLVEMQEVVIRQPEQAIRQVGIWSLFVS